MVHLKGKPDLVDVDAAPPERPSIDAYVYKVAHGVLRAIPHRVDPGDILIRHDGLWVVGSCEEGDTICLSTRLTWHLQCTRNAVGEVTREFPEA